MNAALGLSLAKLYPHPGELSLGGGLDLQEELFQGLLEAVPHGLLLP